MFDLDAFRRRYPRKPQSVLQDWVQRLPLMQQGVLLTGVRGCDTAPKNHASKRVTRAIRAAILNPGRPMKMTFFDLGEAPPLDLGEGWEDELPHHWYAHVLHCAEIIAYKHPDAEGLRMIWWCFYAQMCHALHMPPESEAELDERLSDRWPDLDEGK